MATKKAGSKAKTTKASKAPGIGIYVDQIELTNARIFKREPYILALVATETAGREAAKIQTEPANGINNKRPWTPGPAIELLSPEVDPGGHAVAQVVVMESDRGFRKAGERLGDFQTAMSGTRLGKVVLDAAGIASSGLAVSLVSEATGMAVGLLRSAGDDHLGVATLVVPKNADGSWPVGRYTVETEKCRVTFRVAHAAGEMVDEEPTVIQALARGGVSAYRGETAESVPEGVEDDADDTETPEHPEDNGPTVLGNWEDPEPGPAGTGAADD